MQSIKQLMFLLTLVFLCSHCAFFTSVPSTTTSTTIPTSKPDKETLLRKDIVNYADDFLGSTYLYAGRDPKKGFDCSGFTYYVMKNFDITLSPASRLQENEGKPIKVKDVKPGDLIFYRRSKGGNVFHVSLVYANEPDGIKVIHSTSRGVVIDNITTNSYWAPKISTARDVISM